MAEQLESPGMTLPQMLQAAWDAGDDCCDCPMLHTWQERHPYGMGTAAETLNECRAESMDDCPWIERKLREQAKE